MPPSTVHLPNGQTLAVTPVFGGVSFKVNELSNHKSVFPPGWIVILNELDGDDEPDPEPDQQKPEQVQAAKKLSHRYKTPTLHHDHLFISSMSSANDTEFKPPSSPTRQIAMMLWATLWWYFHQPEPNKKLHTNASAQTAEDGKPRGQWRINIRREGIFKGKNVLAKLERMGLITSEDSSVGTSIDERSGSGWNRMFVTRTAFWQIDARIYLFTQSPVIGSPFPPGSPFSSRPGSPNRIGRAGNGSPLFDVFDEHAGKGSITPMLAGPFQSNSHLPTYYPPHPPHFVFSHGIRHPLRPKPYRQGEIIYVRYIPSLGQYLSFRVASLSKAAPSSQGPWSNAVNQLALSANRRQSRQSISDPIVPTMGSLNVQPSDVELLHKWMNDPRVAHSWGEDGPESHQEEFLRANLQSRHSFPVIGCFDGKPFGYFEIYWVKEDRLGKYLGGNVDNYDRGVHVLVGEQEFRGPHRVKVWLSALVHYCWLSDMRTQTVMLEPRVDNIKLRKYCEEAGFFKEREITFPHKQSNLMKIYRDTWESPAI